MGKSQRVTRGVKLKKATNYPLPGITADSRKKGGNWETEGKISLLLEKVQE